MAPAWAAHCREHDFPHLPPKVEFGSKWHVAIEPPRAGRSPRL